MMSQLRFDRCVEIAEMIPGRLAQLTVMKKCFWSGRIGILVQGFRGRPHQGMSMIAGW
jgi:hypothetical protein